MPVSGAGAGQPRLARVGEAEVLRLIVDEAYGHYVARIGRAPAPMMDDYDRRVADGQAWVLEIGGGIAGLVVLEDDGPGALMLENIAVAPAWQGKGVGRRLMGFTEDEARRRGCREVRLYTNVLMVENIALYGRLGFRETGRVVEKGFSRVNMAKALV